MANTTTSKTGSTSYPIDTTADDRDYSMSTLAEEEYTHIS